MTLAARPDPILPRYFTTKVKLFLAFLLPSAEPASISRVWAPEDSLLGVKLKLPVLRRYWKFRTASPSRYTCMSDLDKVVALSVTVACTVGLEPLMFPTGLTEVMVTPLEPPRLALPLAPDLVLGLALCEFLHLLDLPIGTLLLAGRVRHPRTSLPRTRVPDLCMARDTTLPLVVVHLPA